MSCNASIPIIDTTPIGDEIPVAVGPIVFTLTPTYNVSADFSVTGGATASTEVTQAAYRQVGFKFSTPDDFHPSGSTGCDSPIPAGTPNCTEVSSAPINVSGSATVSGGLNLEFLLAVDYIPNVNASGPYLVGGVALQLTMATQAPVWTLGLSFTADVGFVIDLFGGVVNINASVNILNLTVTLAHAVEVDSKTLPGAVAGQPYVAALASSGGITPYTWGFPSGSNPPSWLALSAGGVLSGIPPVSVENTTVSVTAGVTDSSVPTITAARTLTFMVTPPGALAIITTSPLPAAQAGVFYTDTLRASGGFPSYTWTMTAGSLPTGLSLDLSTGVISGTSTTEGTSSFTASVTDTVNAHVSIPLTITVSPPTSPMTWSAPQSIDPGFALSVSCPSPSFCAAWDWSGRALTWNGSAWSAPQTIDPGLSLTDQLEVPISCASPSFCAAIDRNGNALTWNGSTWSAPQSIDAGEWPNVTFSVSCPSATMCVATDTDNAMTWNGSAWSPPQSIISDEYANGYPLSVSCPSATMCMAFGSGYALTWNGSTWSAPQIAQYVADNALSCPSTTFCVVVSYSGAIMWNGIAWSASQYVDAEDLASVSCPSTTFCAAVDINGDALTWNGIAWSVPQSINANAPPLGGLASVSCPSTTFCVAVDMEGDAIIGRS